METAGKQGGFFISFEGPEGGGKSTQIHRLAAALAERGFSVWTTREPGGTRVGEMIRPILLGPQQQTNLAPWAEALLFTAARAQLVDEVIRPRLLRGELVLCDRFSDSTLAYQGYGRGLELEALARLQAQATGNLVGVAQGIDVAPALRLLGRHRPISGMDPLVEGDGLTVQPVLGTARDTRQPFLDGQIE